MQKIRRATALWADRSGVAITEFAILLPVLIALYLGTVEVTEAIIAKRKLNLAITTIADLASQAQQVQQVQTVTSADATAIFGAGAAIMGNQQTSNLKMRLTSIVIYPVTGIGCVDWSIGNNMAALSAGSTYKAPDELKTSALTARRTFIVAEGSVNFTPPTHSLIPGLVTFREGPEYVVPRATDRVLVDTTVQTPATRCV